MSLQQDFEQTALRHLDAVFRAALALCGRRDIAEDVAQTTFLKAFERFGSFDRGTHCKAWLLRILRNTWIDVLRRRRFLSQQMPLADDIEAKPTIEQTHWSNAEDLLENFSDEQIIRALQRLPDDQRLTVYLVDVEDMSHQEVAEILNVAVGTIKSRASRARTALKEALTESAADRHGLRGRR